jgi:hypothetical protein
MSGCLAKIELVEDGQKFSSFRARIRQPHQIHASHTKNRVLTHDQNVGRSFLG